MKNRFRKLLWLCVVCVGFGTSVASAETTVTEDEAGYFMLVVDQLQYALAEASENLDSKNGVARFRELAKILELHSSVIGIGDSAERTLFAKYLWKANPWINRNLGIANDSGEAPLFPAMFKILETYNDLQISMHKDLRAPLHAAAQAVDGASGLETIGVTKPEAATLTATELDLAILLASLGVATLPASIAREWIYFPRGKADALRYFDSFLRRQEVLPRLRRLSISNQIAALGMGISDAQGVLFAVQNLADFGAGVEGVTPKGERADEAKQQLSVLTEVIRRTQSELTDHGRAPFISVPAPSQVEKFDPKSAIDMARFASSALYEMVLELPNFAHDIIEKGEFATQPHVQWMRKTVYTIGLALSRWKKVENTGNVLLDNMYAVNLFGTRNLMFLANTDQPGQQSQIKRLVHLLEGPGDIGAIRKAAISAKFTQFLEAPPAMPQESKLSEEDMNIVLSIAFGYLRTVGYSLLREARKELPRHNFQQKWENVQRAIQVLGAHVQEAEQLESRYALEAQTGSEWVPIVSREASIVALAKGAEDMVQSLFEIRNGILKEDDQVAQLARLTLVGRARASQDSECGWEFIDRAIDLRWPATKK